jgi:hypothetical protein
MELDVNGRVIEDAKPEDIVAAVVESGSDPDWCVTLSDDDGYVEASRQDDGSFRLVRHDGTTKFDATEPVDVEALKRLLLAYLGGDKRWRKQQDWVRAPSPSKAATASGEPPAWAIAAVVASVALIVVVSNLPRNWLPFLDTTAGTIALFALPVVVMIGAMVANVALKMRKASTWLEVEGRITRSKLMVRRPPAGNDIGTAVNVPDIAYSFMAGGLSYQGRRVSLGDISGTFAEAAVRRYPVGSVVTVYYDPADPTDCVLERGLVLDAPDAVDAHPATIRSDPAAPAAQASTPAAPKANASGCGVALAVLAAFGSAGWWLAHGGVQEIQTRMPRAEVPVMLCAIGFGLALLLFFVGYRRRLMRANAWPVVPGRVTVSRVEQRGGGYDGGTHKSYEAIVEFRYQVGDLHYSSRQIALGLERSGSRKSADAIVVRYPVGAAVEVHYDPANPSEAALENPTGTSWLILGAAIACFGVAVYASRIFR